MFHVVAAACLIPSQHPPVGSGVSYLIITHRAMYICGVMMPEPSRQTQLYAASNKHVKETRELSD